MYLHGKVQIYYLTAVLGVLIGLLGFAYNTWRLEIIENNHNIRTAEFESFKALATLEQIIYARRYNVNEQDGNPRKAWVQVGLISDLRRIVSADVNAEATVLQQRWQENGSVIASEDGNYCAGYPSR